jgi:hypothetical protein
MLIPRASAESPADQALQGYTSVEEATRRIDAAESALSLALLGVIDHEVAEAGAVKLLAAARLSLRCAK